MESDTVKCSGARFSPKKSSSKKYCCVYGCSSNPSKNPDVRFHHFPKPNLVFAKIQNYFGDYEKVDCRKMWERVLKISDNVREHMVVCSLHFTKNDYILPDQARKQRYLKKDAIPSCNLPNAAANQEKAHIHSDARNQRYLERQEKKSQNKTEDKNSADKTNDEFSNEENNNEEVNEEVNKDNNPDNSNDVNELPLNETTPSESNFSEKKMVDFSTQVTSGDFIVDYFDTVQTDLELNTLTGIANFKIFNKLITIIETGYPVYRSKTMKLRSKLLMTFMKLKHNVSYAILKALFKYQSISQCRKIIVGMIERLHFCLRDAVYFPSKEEVSKNIPLCFAEFTDVRVVLDCTEIHIQRPKELCCQQATYSRYKSDFTIKFMTGVTPGGMISFVSKAYGGKISDDAIFQQSNILDLLEKGDAIMVDKGFRVEKLCKKKDIKLIRPPFKEEKKQFSREEARMSAKIARSRVHIERSNQRLKVFKILGSRMPSGLVSHADKIMTIITAIVNMSSPILKIDKFHC